MFQATTVWEKPAAGTKQSLTPGPREGLSLSAAILWAPPAGNCGGEVPALHVGNIHGSIAGTITVSIGSMHVVQNEVQVQSTLLDSFESHLALDLPLL